MNTRFEILDHTADTGIITYGENLEEAFENAALGMFSIITELKNIKKDQTREINVSSTDRDSLLVDWLNELIYLFDVENLVFSKFDIIHLTDTTISAVAYGEKVDLSRHEIKTGIKAATYHMLEIKESDSCRIQVLFDL